MQPCRGPGGARVAAEEQADVASGQENSGMSAACSAAANRNTDRATEIWTIQKN